MRSVFITMILVACGTSDTTRPLTTCTTKQTDDGAEINCTDGSRSVLKNGISPDAIKGDKGDTIVGPIGPQGNTPDTPKDGTDGKDAYQIVFQTIASTTCPNGGNTILMATDSNRNGSLDMDDTNQTSLEVCNGAQGERGEPGQNCSFNTGVINCGSSSYTLPTPQDGHSVVFSVLTANAQVCPAGGSIIMLANDINDNNLLDTDDNNIQSVTTCNGVDGSDGADGEDGVDAPVSSGLGLVSLIDPCNHQTTFDEVLIRLSDGNILASFSENANGKNTRFSLLTIGQFSTTDSTNCNFSVDNNLTVTDQLGNKWYK